MNQSRHTETVKSHQRVIERECPCENSAVKIKMRRSAPLPFLGTMLLAALFLARAASAQQQSAQNPQSPSPGATAQTQTEQPRAEGGNSESQSKEPEVNPEDDRLFGVLPNYLTVENAASVPPLTSGGKFKLVAKNTFDPVVYPFIGFIALVNQAADSDPGFGQGFAGYAKRYGASFGDSVVGNFMAGAILPSVLKQDPRYYQRVHGGFGRRALYSVSRILITRSDSGHRQFNSSEIFGNLVQAGISNAYHPAQDRTIGNTMRGWGNGLGWDTMSNLSQEFWPDIHVWLKQKFGGKHR